MSRAVFLDRDGTINVDKGNIWKIRDFDFIPKAINALKELEKSDYKIVVITNQGKVGTGLCTLEDVIRLNDYMVGRLKEEGIKIDAVYLCQHHPDEGCSCRKPEPGLIVMAGEELGLELKGCYMVGDKTSDIMAGKNAGCRTVLVRTGYAGKDSRCNVKPDYVADDLYGAVKWILAQK